MRTENRKNVLNKEHHMKIEIKMKTHMNIYILRI